MLDQFVQLLDQLDEVVALGTEGRSAHMGATRELKSAAVEIGWAVRVMDGRNRQRFAEDQQVLGLGSARAGCWGRRGRVRSHRSETPEGGEVEPAA